MEKAPNAVTRCSAARARGCPLYLFRFRTDCQHDAGCVGVFPDVPPHTFPPPGRRRRILPNGDGQSRRQPWTKLELHDTEIAVMDIEGVLAE